MSPNGWLMDVDGILFTIRLANKKPMTSMAMYLWLGFQLASLSSHNKSPQARKNSL